MKYLLLLLSGCIAFICSFAQDAPVTWQYSTGRQANSQYTLIFTATISKGWRLFSTSMSDNDPNTRIHFDSAGTAILATGNTHETGDLKSSTDSALGGLQVKYFENTVRLELSVTAKRKIDTLKGVLTYMAYRGDSIPGPQDVPFKFVVLADGKLVATTA